MTSAITATRLRKSFGGTAVLDGIDLEVAAGTTFSLLGPNGAAKTTTVQIMSTLVHTDGGEAGVAGHDVALDPAAVRAAIGVPGQFCGRQPAHRGGEPAAVNAWLVRAAAALQRSDRDQRLELRGSGKRTKQRFTGWARWPHRTLSHTVSSGLRGRLTYP